MSYDNTIIADLDIIKQQLTQNDEKTLKKFEKLESSLPSILQQSLSPILIKLNDVESCVKQINAKQIKTDLENTKQELIKTKADFEVTKNGFIQQLAKKDEEIVKLKEKQLVSTVDNGIVYYEWDSTNQKHIRVRKTVDSNTPIGSIASFSNAIPYGWLKANGCQYDTNHYQFNRSLFSVIGYKYGGKYNNFRLPRFTESSNYNSRYLFIKAE